MTDAFDVYVLYLALKQHFNSDSYDFFKYNGRIKANKGSFLKRNDRYFFHKIAKQQKDPTKFMVANFLQGNFYPSDVASAEVIYTKWKAHQEKLSYAFKDELSNLESPFFNNFKTNGQYPVALKMYMQGKISIDTLVLVDRIFRGEVIQYWDSTIQDPVVWPNTSRRLKKYAPFVKVDTSNYYKILVDLFPEILDK